MDDCVPGSRGRVGALVLVAILGAAVALLAGFPAVHALLASINAPPPGENERLAFPSSDSPAALALRTVGVAGLIGVLSAGLAWPAAWAARTAGPGLLALLVAPLLLPNYLAYAGLNLVRAPGTSIGAWLGGQPEWVSLIAARLIAVAGLTLWAWPLALLVLLPAVRRVPDSLLDDLAMNRVGLRGAVGTVWALVRMTCGALVKGSLLVTLVMLGSAVPLHVAQFDTYAIHLWLLLSLTGRPETVWLESWPLVLAAVLGAAAVGVSLRRSARRADTASEASEPIRRAGRAAQWAGAAVWLVSVGLPFVLLLGSLRRPPAPWRPGEAMRLIGAFWRLSADAVLASAAVAACVGVAAMIIGAAAWAAASSLGNRYSKLLRGAAGAALMVLLVAGLLPGVLVGSAMASAWNAVPMTRELLDTPVVLVAGHLTRFGFLAVLAGVLLAAAEEPTQRDLRLLDGAVTLRGWFSACATRWLPALAGVGLSAALLSFHEIEASVMLQPPGMESFARQTLDNLHFARDDRLAAAAVSLLWIGVLLAYGSARLARPLYARAGFGEHP